jgi:hypothetical protein
MKGIGKLYTIYIPSIYYYPFNSAHALTSGRSVFARSASGGIPRHLASAPPHNIARPLASAMPSFRLQPLEYPAAPSAAKIPTLPPLAGRALARQSPRPSTPPSAASRSSNPTGGNPLPGVPAVPSPPPTSEPETTGVPCSGTASGIFSGLFARPIQVDQVNSLQVRRLGFSTAMEHCAIAAKLRYVISEVNM